MLRAVMPWHITGTLPSSASVTALASVTPDGFAHIKTTERHRGLFQMAKWTREMLVNPQLRHLRIGSNWVGVCA
eukprot:937773-Karenia_brevis.AAC.1